MQALPARPAHSRSCALRIVSGRSGIRPHSAVLRAGLASLLLALPVASSCSADEVPENDPHELAIHLPGAYEADLPEILERKYLRVLTSNNSFDYFIFQGQRRGLQYEMVKAFAEHLNRKYSAGRKNLKIQFELIPVESQQLIPLLRKGAADLIAARLTITPERSRRILFTTPYRKVDELVVTHLPPAQVEGDSDSIDSSILSGRKVAVRRGSSYFESLVEANRELLLRGLPPIRIELVDSKLETESILSLVAAGHFDFSVADSLVAETAAALFPGLRIVEGLQLRRDGELAWATRPDSSALAAELNEFLPRYRHGSLLGNIAIKRYFEDLDPLRVRLEQGDTEGLSPYDATLKQYSQEYGFDWRLMAAVAYQESRFQQTSHNRSGATGLFQIKPKTAREPYIGIPEIAGEENADNNVHAGIKYLAWIKARYFDAIDEMPEPDRVRMTLAAYNAGPGTLINARRKAEAMSLDPNRWFRNVELAMLEMRKYEPVKYVSEVNQRYLSYRMLGVK
jgi:membrane-bound lytic murein transglycosylase MltF